jgi:hypothetical protein
MMLQMIKETGNFLSKDKWLYAILCFLFVASAIWFAYIHTLDFSANERLRQEWASLYQVIALFGCIVGFIAAKKWDGHKSIVGKSILFFSVGLLLQTLGQSVVSYYNFFQNQSIPYPSLGDIGFMGTDIAYIVGAWYLLKATGFQYSKKTMKKKIIVIFVPLIVIISCYLFFLQGYQFDWSNPVKIVLDFAYPLGSATYISIVLIAYLTAINYSLGIMKKPLFFLLVALAFQYIADFTFLYQANAGTWSVGGLNDFLYFTSYCLMAFALLVMGGVRRILPEL